MSVTAGLLLVAASLYAGFQWTVRLIVYPQFASVGAAQFAAYEAGHQRRTAWAVGPLFVALGLTTLAVVLDPPSAASRWLVAAPAVLFGIILGVTAFLAVPLHRQLGHGYDGMAHQKLMHVDTVRLAAALLDVVVAAALVWR